MQALEYTKVGASVLSVLTEPKWFKGTLQDLREVREATQAWAKEAGVRRPACLRKDFLIDEYQAPPQPPRAQLGPRWHRAKWSWVASA